MSGQRRGWARRSLAAIRCGLLILVLAGPRIFVAKLAHQLYSRTTMLGVVRDLSEPLPPASFACVVEPATGEDMAALARQVRLESREGRYQLLVRLWYHERGFGECHVTRSADTGELRYVQWLVTAEQLREIGWETRFSGLQEDEVLLENLYTLEKFRRRGVRQASFTLAAEACLERGFRRFKGWTFAENVPNILADRKENWLMFERLEERHTLFRVSRRVVESYDPPIAIPLPPGHERV